MGWWRAGEDGSPLGPSPGQSDLLWGDAPCDAMGFAIEQIENQFWQAWERKPTRKELEAGLRFTLSGYDDDNEKE